MDKSLISIVLALLGLAAFFYWLERNKFSVKEISIIAVLAGIAASARLPFAFIPNVQPTTFLVIISGFVFGCGSGFLVGAISALISNFFLGQGPWTIWQMLAWGFCGATAGILGKFNLKSPKIPLIIFGLLWGYLFGWIMNFWYWYSFTYPLTLKSWILVNASSFWLDTLHSAGNCFFIWLFGEKLIKILKHFKKKLIISYN